MGSGDGSASNSMVVGCLVRWLPHGIYGVVETLDGRRATVSLDNGTTQIFATSPDVIERIRFEIGTQVTSVGSEVLGVVLGSVPAPQPTWLVGLPDRRVNVPERSLRPAEIREPVERMRNGRLGRATDFNLKSVAADLWTQHLHNDLVSLAHARVDLHPHQVGVAHRVISTYPHRFLLCDEVGLGKTIEAAMIIKELRARKQANRVLILVPSGLQRQWQFELKTKFNESFAIYNRDTIAYLKNQGGVEHPWAHHNLVITSQTWASWDDRRQSDICAVDWDLVIVDEAHHAREQKYGTRVQRTKLYRLVHQLIADPARTRRAALLLTATPMQLQRHELYSLVEMLDPVLFASESDFTQHITSLGGLNAMVEMLKSGGIPEDPEARMELAEEIERFLGLEFEEAAELVGESTADELVPRLLGAHRLSEILIRNRRVVVGGFQPRTAFRWPVSQTELEREVYALLQQILIQGFDLAERTRSNAIGFLMATFQRLATSSSRALLVSLQRRLHKSLPGTSAGRSSSEEAVEEALESDASAADAIETLAPDADLDISLLTDLIALLSRIGHDSKAIVLAQQLYDLFGEDDNAKVLIFTQFRETQAMLAELLGKSGWEVHLFHGQLSPLDKDRSVEAFRNGKGAQILVSTEAGGEGRNFQFCHLLVNYDLPWNPMKVEQRIGRVDRIGQEHPVAVFNLYVEGTIEERVLEVLERRINLFTEAIGGLEPILGGVEADIRKAIRLAGEDREVELDRVAARTEERVRAARTAERQMADLILDTKSFSAEIARIARGAVQPVSQSEYEEYLRRLLASANTYMDGPDRQGVYKVMFHAPLTLEHPELTDGRDKRRVCFDPRSNVDSEMVEYLGFGHPIVDVLTEARIEGWHEGAAAVRRMPVVDTNGWQFNWLVNIGGLRPRRLVHPVFVSDDGTGDRDVGRYLLLSSRLFDREDAPLDDAGNLDEAYEVALGDVGALVTELDLAARAVASDRVAEEQARIEAWHRHRKLAAGDKLESVSQTLDRLRQSTRSEDQAVVPLWQANEDRALAEIDRVDRDRDELLADVNRRTRPDVGYELLNVARVLTGGTG